METSSSDFRSYSSLTDKTFKKLKILKFTFDAIIFWSVTLIVTSIILVSLFYKGPRSEIDSWLLIFFPGIYGATLLAARFMNTFFKYVFIYGSYVLAVVFTVVATTFMAYNSESPWFAPLANKIMSIVFIVGWDCVLFGCAFLLKNTILLANMIKKDHSRSQIEKVSNFIAEPTLQVKPQSFYINYRPLDSQYTNQEAELHVCPVHGAIHQI